MAVAIEIDWEDRFYAAVTDYLEGDGDRTRVESLWQRYELDSVEDPRLGSISTKVRRLMEDEYRGSDLNRKEIVLTDVKDLLEQYYSETKLDKY